MTLPNGLYEGKELEVENPVLFFERTLIICIGLNGIIEKDLTSLYNENREYYYEYYRESEFYNDAC